DRCTGMTVTGRNLDRIGNALCGDRDGAVVDGAVAQLAEIVLTPARDGSVITQRAGVCSARSDRNCAGKRAQIGDGHRRGTVAGTAVAHLSRIISAPTAGITVGAHRAGALVTASDCDQVAQARYGYWEQAIGRGAVTDFAAKIVAPALKRAV